MILRWLALLIWLVPQFAQADAFQPADVQRIQVALQTLGYPVVSVDGIWRDDTSQTLAQYRFDFGMEDVMGLRFAEATELLTRAKMLTDPPGLVWADTSGWSEWVQPVSPEPATLDPLRQLFASSRHALAMEMQDRFQPYKSAHAFDPYKGWAEGARARARLWLEDDIRRIDAADPVGGLLGKTLIEIDLDLDIPDGVATRDDMTRSVFPRLRLLMDSYPEPQLGPDLNQGLTEKIMATLLRALGRSNCHDERRIDAQWVALSMDVMARYEKLRPGAPELRGAAKALAPCADKQTADRMLTWRIAVAQAASESELAFTIGIERMHDAFSRANLDVARSQFDQLFAIGTEVQRQDLIERTPLRDLGLRDVALPYIMTQIDAMRGVDIMVTATVQQAMRLPITLLEIGYGFEIADRVYLETNNSWRKNGDVFGFYAGAISLMIDRAEFDDALLPLGMLIDRATAAKDNEAIETFRDFQLEALLALGRFSEAEDRIGGFVEIARQGAKDPRVAAWQARLNLASEEGQSPGITYAEQFSVFLDALCRPDAPYPETPAMEDRATVYDDPSFLPAAAVLKLSDRIATCKTEPYPTRTEQLIRLGCYFWAKEENLSQLTIALQAWLLKIEDLDTRSTSVVLTEHVMDCPMGVAEAGRTDLLAQFVAQIDTNSTADAVVLLRLGLLNPDYARWVLGWSGLNRSGPYDVDFPSMEAMTQLDDPEAVTLRQEALGGFFLSYAGASASPGEMATIRALSLDSAAGYSALDLDGVALFFLESAEPDLERAPDAEQADLLLADAETARFYLLRGRLALKFGDNATALAMVAPVVTAYLYRAGRGEAGSVEDLGPWARRLRGFAELYLSALAADPALMAAEPPENIVAAQQLLAAANASTTSGRLAARLSAVDPVLVRDYQDALRDLRGAMMAATTGGDATAVGEKRAQVDTLREQIAKLDPGFGANAALSIAPLSSLQARATGRAIVILTSLPGHLLVSTVTETGAVSKALALPRHQVVETIAAFRATILREEDVATPEGALLASAVLSGLLDKGVLPDAIGFVVDGPFVSLPFGALPIRLGNVQSYLGAEAALSITPSLALLAVRGDAANKPTDRPFLGIGNASFSLAGAQERLGFVPSELRETKTELMFMGGLLGADIAKDVLLGPDASETAITRLSEQGSLSSYRVIAFATHGFVGNQGKLQEAGLLLSEPAPGEPAQDGVLSVSEIYGLKLAADLVILSACDTGAVTDGNQGLSNLAQAFTYAGAKGLIVTHWAVDTYAATELSKRLATEMRESPQESNARAFQAVLRSLLADPDASEFHHPKYWASHAVVGS